MYNNIAIVIITILTTWIITGTGIYYALLILDIIVDFKVIAFIIFLMEFTGNLSKIATIQTIMSSLNLQQQQELTKQINYTLVNTVIIVTLMAIILCI